MVGIDEQVHRTSQIHHGLARKLRIIRRLHVPLMNRSRPGQSLFVQVLALGLLGLSANFTRGEDNIAASAVAHQTGEAATDESDSSNAQEDASGCEGEEQDAGESTETPANEESEPERENASVTESSPSASETAVTNLLLAGALATEPEGPSVPLAAPPPPERPPADRPANVQLGGIAQAILNAGAIVLVLAAASVYTASLRRRLAQQNEFIQKRGEALAAVEARLRETFAATRADLEAQLDARHAEIAQLQGALEAETTARLAAETALRATEQTAPVTEDTGHAPRTSVSLARFLEFEGGSLAHGGNQADRHIPPCLDRLHNTQTVAWSYSCAPELAGTNSIRV